MLLGLPKSLRLSACALACVLAAASAQAQTLSLTTDRATAPVREVVNLTATLQGTPTPGASITFYDYAAPIYTIPLSPTRNSVLSIASLPIGAHNLSARYTPSGSPVAIISPPVAVTITPLASTFAVARDISSPFAGNALSFTASALPADATGTIQFAEHGLPLASTTISGSTIPRYQAFGDSITFGATLTSGSQRYPTLLSSALGLTLSDYGVPGAIACDVLPLQILRHATASTQALAPLSSLMIGTNDLDFWGTGVYEPIFNACHQSALAWLAIPREYKVLPNDPGATPLTGNWSYKPDAFDATYGTLYNSTGSGTARFTLTSSGAPVYLWYLLRDLLHGTFTLTIDGVPSPTVYSTHPAHFIGSVINPDQAGFALVRLPLPPGLHHIDVQVLSGTVGILAAGTPPPAGSASVHPIVLVGDLPPQLVTNPVASAADQALYIRDIRNGLALLQADGLDLRPIPIGQFLHATPAEMDDQIHPSALGHAHLADAFETAMPDIARFAAFANTPASAPITFAQPGTHVVDITYSGDSIYAPSTHSLTVNLLAKASTAISLSTSSTSAIAGNPVLFSAIVVPAAGAGTLSLWDGTQFLDQANVTTNGASFSISTLAPGTHSIFALYSGDGFSQASQSPPLTLTILPTTSTLKLAPLPSHIAFASPLTLSAALASLTATGTVTFTDTYIPARSTAAQAQYITLGQSPFLKGVATLTPATLDPGTHTFTAVYSGDTANTPSTAPTLTVTVDLLPTTTALQPVLTPLLYGTPTTFTASVLPSSSTGTITFSDLTGTLAQVNLSGGTATFTSATLTPGTHSLTATYSGDLLHASSTSAALVNQVNPAPSSIALAPLSPSLNLGAPVTLTSSVTPLTATGTVLFRDASAGALGQASIANGVASLTLPSLPLASYNIIATYSGDAFIAPATSAPISTRVVLASTQTTLSPIPTTLAYATPLTLSATIAPAAATGSITFSDNGQTLAALPLLNGSATFTTQTLPVGTHTLVAAFSGNSTNAPSSSTAALSITAAHTVTTLSLAQVNLPAGTPLIVNVRITSSSPSVPGGTVTLRSGSTTLTSAPLGNGTPGEAYATLQAPAPTTLGTFPIVALYSGDATDTPSDSSATPTAFTILPTPTFASLTLSATQVPPQTPITLTASFTSASLAVPTGTVTFLNGGTPLGTATVDPNGSATFTVPARPIGAFSLSATLVPTGLFAASASPAQSLFVTAPLTLALASSTLNLAPGATASTTLTLTPLSGFHGSITTACQSPVSYVTCTVDAPAALTPSPTTATLHIAIRPNQQASIQSHRTATTLAATLALLLPYVLNRKTRRRLPGLLTCALLFAAIASTLTGCAEGGTFGLIPPGTQVLRVDILAAGTTTSSQISVTIK